MLDLERREEALDRRVVPAVAAPTRAASDALVNEKPLEILACVPAALVEVMQQHVRFATPPQRHQQRIEQELEKKANRRRARKQLLCSKLRGGTD